MSCPRCERLDDEIENLESQIVDLKAEKAALHEKIDAAQSRFEEIEYLAKEAGNKL